MSLMCQSLCRCVRVRMLFWPSLAATSSTRLCRPASVFWAVSREWKPGLYWVSIKRNESGNMRGYCTSSQAAADDSGIFLSHSVSANAWRACCCCSFLPASSSSLISSLSKSTLHKPKSNDYNDYAHLAEFRSTANVHVFPIMFRVEHVVNQIGTEMPL